ncbi:MAG: hypothetical protein Q7T79_00890 [bacterium]|nr:hypothetical protein [bacterium]
MSTRDLRATPFRKNGMNKRLSMRILSVVWLAVLAILGAYSIDSSVWVRPHLSFLKSAANNRDTINVASYIYGKTPLVWLGEIKNPDNAFIHLKLRFHTDNTEGNPNVFQTAPVNRGMRMEISGSTAAIIVPDLSVPGDLKGLTLTTALKIGQWYTLEVEALNGAYVSVKLDGKKVVDYASVGLSMETSQLLVGGGFDASRVFRGQMEDISITKGNVPQSWHLFFSSISNRGILIFSFVCIFIVVMVRMVNVGILTNLLMPHRISNMAMIGLVLIQMLLLLILPAYRNVVIVYLFLFLIGINQYILFTPTFLKERFSYFVLVPLNGLLQLSVLGAYLVGFSIKIKLLVPALLCISLIAYLLNFKLNRDKFVSMYAEMKEDYSIALIGYTLVITPIILCLIFPVLLTEYSTSPYRLGPDMASYAKMAQYLLDGGTWAEANLRAGEFAGMSPGDINRYSDATMSWPLMYYFRWGLTAFQAAVTTITFSKHSFETAFISMALPYIFTCGLVLIWLRRQMGLGGVAAILGAVAFAFNPNILNLWYEGFYGNSYALGFFIPILYMFLHFRSKEKYAVGDITKSISFSSILFAASLLSYAEGVVFVLAAFMIILFIVDSLMSKSINWTPYLIVLSSACIGVLIVLPCGFIVEWAVLAIKQLTQEGGNGYAQPLWAFPNEILGFPNIYLNTSVEHTGKLLHRTNLSLVYSCIISVLVLYSIFVYFRKRRREENVLYMASILMVAVSACFVYYKSPNNNYTYMKMYVFHLPLLFIIFWGSLHIVFEKHFTKFFNLDSKWLHLFVAMPIVISGMVYIIQYKEESISIEKFRIELHSEIKQLNFDNVVMYPIFINKGNPNKDILYRDMYPAVLPTPWMIPSLWSSGHWKDKPYYKNFMSHKVYLFIEKESSHSYVVQNGEVVFQNQCCLIIDSGKIIRDGIKSEDNSIDFDVYTHSIKEFVGKGV